MVTKPSAESVIALTGATLPEAVVSGIIDDAALLVERCVVSLGADRQTAIIKWVAAHLIASGPERMLQSERLGQGSDTYATARLGEGLKGTTYGQQALALDPNGCLARLGRARATLEKI